MQQAILKQLTQDKSTPAYIFDVTKLKHKVLSVLKELKSNNDIELCYAMKANPFLIKSLDFLIEKFEVCSPGELSFCKKENIMMNKIILSGVNKEKDDIRRAMSWGVGTYTIESKEQLLLIQRCAADAGIIVQALIRLTSGNQFGIDKDEIRQIIGQRNEFPNINIRGIQFYSGTQKKGSKILKEIDELSVFCEDLEKEFCVSIENLEYGPGFGIEYFGKGDEENTLLDECKKSFKNAAEKRTLTLEMGRFLVADCGYYITEVIDVKRNNGQEYCIVDGGINHVNYYGQVMGVRIPPVRFYRKEDGKFKEEALMTMEKSKEGLCVCGSLCTVADVLIRSVPITKVASGDVFVFERIGAYSVTEGIYLFLSRKMPRVYLLEDGSLKLIRDSYETYEINSYSRE